MNKKMRVYCAHLFVKTSTQSVWATVLLIFLFPVFSFPWTADALEMNKQLLLGIGTAISFFLVAHRILSTGWVSVKSFFWYLPFLLTLGVLILSALSFGGYPVSWFGTGLQEYQSVLTVLLLLVFCWGISEHDWGERDLRLLLQAFVAAPLLSLLAFWFSLLFRGSERVWQTVGNTHELALVALIGFLVCAAVYHYGQDDGKQTRFFCLILWAYVFLLLPLFFLLDSWVIWTLLLVGMMCLFFLLPPDGVRPRASHNYVFLVLTMGSILFLLFPTPFRSHIPSHVTPSWKADAVVLWQSWKESPLLGSGPGTYIAAYGKHRPQEINRTPLWDVRFDRASTHLFTVSTTTGIFGLLAFLGLCMLGGAALWSLYKHRALDASRCAVAVGWIVVAISAVVTSWNMTTTVFFFVFLTLLVHAAGGASARALKPRRWVSLHQLLFALASLVILTAGVVLSRKVVADVFFTHALRLHEANAAEEEVMTALLRAVKVNAKNDLYFRNLAQAFLFRVGALTNRPLEGEQDPGRRAELLQSLVSGSVNTAKAATDLAPHQVINWRVRGAIYRELLPFVQKADTFAVLSYQRAMALEPLNPINHIELARVYIAMAERLSSVLQSPEHPDTVSAAASYKEYLEKADTALLRAQELKPDYAPGWYYQALVREREGKMGEALQTMQKVKILLPLDPQVAYSMGILSLKTGDRLGAHRELERAISLVPTYADARWLLATLYEDEGNAIAAQAQIAAIAQFNEQNPQVQARFERLKSGVIQSSLATQIPTIPPLQ